MSYEQMTPVDERAGFPLMVIPEGYEGKLSPNGADLNHAFHPRSHPELQGIAGLAVRECRVQRLPWHLHHNLYHKEYMGPPLPEDVTSKFKMVIMAKAGYVPETGIMFRAKDDGPSIRRISSQFRRHLWHSGSIFVKNPGKVRNFIQDYVLTQDLSDVDDSMVDQFLRTTKPGRRIELGHQLLGLAVERAVEPIVSVYSEAQKQELIHPTKKDIGRFVLDSLGYRHQRACLQPRLEMNLIDQYYGQQAA